MNNNKNTKLNPAGNRIFWKKDCKKEQKSSSVNRVRDIASTKNKSENNVKTQ